MRGDGRFSQRWSHMIVSLMSPLISAGTSSSGRFRGVARGAVAPPPTISGNTKE